jgi:hypothetical protein
MRKHSKIYFEGRRLNMKKLLKHGIFALSAALLVTAFITSCPPPIGELSGAPRSSGPGVQLAFGDVNARTIKGNTLAVGNFASFKLTFTPTAGFAFTNPIGGTVVPIVRNFNGPATGTGGLSSQKFALTPGTYTLETIAYMTTGQADAAATAENTGIIIAENTGLTTVVIALEQLPVDPTSGAGKFGWNISTSGVNGLASATMGIVPLNGGTETWQALTAIDLTTTGNTTTAPYTLASGYYDVICTLNNGTETISFQQVLWVEAGRTTPAWVFAFNDSFFGIPTYTVTFKSWDYGAATPANVTIDTATVTPTSAIGAANVPAAQIQSGYTFLGWYETDAHSSGGTNPTPWGAQVTGTTVPEGNMDAFARWLKDGDLDGPGITLTPIGDTAIILYNSTSSAGVTEGQSISLANGGTLVLIDNNSAGTFSTIAWIRNGTTVATGGTLTFTSGGGTNSIDSDDGGAYTIIVRAVTALGEYQSSYFTVNVAP